MEIVRRHILKHISGAMVNIRYEAVKTIRSAARLTPEEFETLMTSYHKPVNRNDYYLQEIEISYREVGEDEREHDGVREGSGSTGRSA
jgi:hypothetical protein